MLIICGCFAKHSFQLGRHNSKKPSETARHVTSELNLGESKTKFDSVDTSQVHFLGGTIRNSKTSFSQRPKTGFDLSEPIPPGWKPAIGGRLQTKSKDRYPGTGPIRLGLAELCWQGYPVNDWPKSQEIVNKDYL